MLERIKEAKSLLPVWFLKLEFKALLPVSLIFNSRRGTLSFSRMWKEENARVGWCFNDRQFQDWDSVESLLNSAALSHRKGAGEASLSG